MRPVLFFFVYCEHDLSMWNEGERRGIVASLVYDEWFSSDIIEETLEECEAVLKKCFAKNLDSVTPEQVMELRGTKVYEFETNGEKFSICRVYDPKKEKFIQITKTAAEKLIDEWLLSIRKDWYKSCK